jgi:hypothetical protein
MNNVVKDICEQAKLFATSTHSPYGDDDCPTDWLDLYTEKFVELLVKEAARLADQLEQDEHWVDPAYVVITNHFGIAR